MAGWIFMKICMGVMPQIASPNSTFQLSALVNINVTVA
jgi:hypothetical protein